MGEQKVVHLLFIHDATSWIENGWYVKYLFQTPDGGYEALMERHS